jgi:ABC-2 type transport system ATP-binding protein
MDNGAAVSVRDLRKSYGDVTAVAGIDVEIARGEVFALLGPNGTGKTTTVEILEGFRRRDQGTVSVLGQDPAQGDRAWRARIGIVLQLPAPGRNSPCWRSSGTSPRSTPGRAPRKRPSTWSA